MTFLIRRPHSIRASEITPEATYKSRRTFMSATGGIMLGAAGLMAGLPMRARANPDHLTEWLQSRIPAGAGNPSFDEPITPFELVTGYNNYYEFGTDKSDPARYAHQLTIHPWSVEIAGEVAKPGIYGLEDILAPHDFEERVYRLRCVEAWSMVIPWIGFPLADLLRRFEPTSDARYVEFTTLYRPAEMPGQRALGFLSSIDFPYVEGLRIDEAMHPLTLLATGMYGRTLPSQNGAPLRLVVPWKYGFKSIKGIVRIRLTSTQPDTTWNLSAPREYGFYANVNPQVDHPRWSQASERKVGASFFSRRIETRMFNGYADEVASLYANMNLRRYY